MIYFWNAFYVVLGVWAALVASVLLIVVTNGIIYMLYALYEYLPHRRR